MKKRNHKARGGDVTAGDGKKKWGGRIKRRKRGKGGGKKGESPAQTKKSPTEQN